MTTADTGTAPERVFHTCTYFSLFDLWSEWELAGRKFFRDFKKRRSGLVSALCWLLFCFRLARFVACFARFVWPFLVVFCFSVSAVCWALFFGGSRHVWICLVTG